MVHIRRINESAGATDLANYFSQEYPEIAIERGDRAWNEYKENIERRLNSKKHQSYSDTPSEYDFETLGKFLKKVNVDVDEDLLVWLANMTSENYHKEARYEIARYFTQFSEDMRQFEVYYRSFVEAFCKEGKRHPKDWVPSGIMDDMMFITIGKIFGEDVVRKLTSCL